MSNEELVERIQKGEQELVTSLWDQVRRFICNRAYAFARYNVNRHKVDPEDLIQSGYLALIDAIKSYDPYAGCTFINFLNFFLKRSFRKEIGIYSSRRDAILEAHSLDAPLAGEQECEISLLDTIPSDDATDDFEDLIDRLDTQRMVEVVFTEMKKLKEQEQGIIVQAYIQQRPHKDIAEHYGITTNKVNQIKVKGIRSLRAMPLIRKLRREISIDQQTSFYKQKGYRAFNTSFTSVVEDLVLKREEQREKHLQPRALI